MTSDDKYFQQAYRVYMNLIWLNGEVGPGAGDVSGGADFPPTDTSVDVMETIEKDLNAAKADYKTLMDRDVPAFNRAIGGAMTPLTGGRIKFQIPNSRVSGRRYHPLQRRACSHESRRDRAGDRSVFFQL